MGSVAMSPGGQCLEDKRKTCGHDASPDTAWHATLKSIEREKMSILVQPHNHLTGRLGALAQSWPQGCMCCAEVATEYTELAMELTGR